MKIIRGTGIALIALFALVLILAQASINNQHALATQMDLAANSTWEVSWATQLPPTVNDFDGTKTTQWLKITTAHGVAKLLSPTVEIYGTYKYGAPCKLETSATLEGLNLQQGDKLSITYPGAETRTATVEKICKSLDSNEPGASVDTYRIKVKETLRYAKHDVLAVTMPEN